MSRPDDIPPDESDSEGGECDVLPCPFCGAAARMYKAEFERTRTTLFEIACSACDTGTGTTAEAAIAAWNRRAQPAHDRPALADALRQCVDALCLAGMICDGVPTRAQDLDESSPLRRIGRLVNDTEQPWGKGYDLIRDAEKTARAALAAEAQPLTWETGRDDQRVDAIVSGLYRRFKDWHQRGFGPDEVTWCEVKADVIALLAAEAQPAEPWPPRDGMRFALQTIAAGVTTTPRAVAAAALAEAQPAQPEPVALANRDELDNMLDDRTATVAGVRDGWRKTPLYAAPQPEPAREPAGWIAAEDAAALLPGAYYMDPPDGGSVTLLEQLKRMAEDAARWRQQASAPREPARESSDEDYKRMWDATSCMGNSVAARLPAFASAVRAWPNNGDGNAD